MCTFAFDLGTIVLELGLKIVIWPVGLGNGLKDKVQ
jgi:hypothetical protein